MKPIKLELENFFSHKESTILFDFNSAVLIGNTDGDYNKSNGSGKSSLFEGITWALFNKSRAPTVNDLVKWGEEKCTATITFVEGDSEYKITRSRNRVSSSSHVSFFKKDEIGDWKDISGSTSSLTNDIIEKTIKMDYKTFVNSTYFKQNDISEFAESAPGDRKALLKNVLDLGKWDEYEEVAKKELKKLKIDLQILESDLVDSEELKIQLGQANYSKNNIEKDLEKLRNKIVSMDSRYNHVFERYVKLKNSLDTEQYDKIMAEITDAKEKIDFLTKTISSSRKYIKKQKDVLKGFEDDIEAQNDYVKNFEYREDVDDLKEANRENIINSTTKLQMVKLKADEVENTLISEGDCGLCGQEISQELYDDLVNQKYKKLDDLQKEIVDCQNLLNSHRNEKKNIDNIVSINKKIDSARNTISLIESKVVIVKENISEKELELSDKVKSKKELESKISGLETCLEGIKDLNFADTKSELKLLKEEKETLYNLISEKEKNLSLTDKEISDIEKSIEDNIELKKKISNLKEEIAVYDHLKKYLGKQGIQVILLNGLIEDLEHYANNILKDICNEPLQISLETQRVRSDKASIVETLDLIIIKDGFKHDFKSLSGGEKFRISLSLRIGLGQLASKYGGGNLEFIMMDEINSPLDKYGTENLFVSVINKLEKKYMVMLITHEETLKDKFSNVIDISKINGESSVNYYNNS